MQASSGNCWVLNRMGRRLTGLAICAALTFPASAVWGQSTTIEDEADAILRAMADEMKGIAAFSVEYDVDHEIVDLQGQKLQYSASGTITASRDAGFLITRRGPFADLEVSFDGRVVSLHGKGLNAYAQLDSPGPSFDDAVQELRMSTGFDAAGADLLSADPYAVLTENVASGAVVGTAFIGSVECDHLAFRTDSVDWQIWIARGEQKLPMKYVITTKWLTGAPQYTLRLSNWTVGDVDTNLFSFTPPADARKLDTINADAIGDLVLEANR